MSLLSLTRRRLIVLTNDTLIPTLIAMAEVARMMDVIKFANLQSCLIWGPLSMRAWRRWESKSQPTLCYCSDLRVTAHSAESTHRVNLNLVSTTYTMGRPFVPADNRTRVMKRHFHNRQNFAWSTSEICSKINPLSRYIPVSGFAARCLPQSTIRISLDVWTKLRQSLPRAHH